MFQSAINAIRSALFHTMLTISALVFAWFLRDAKTPEQVDAKLGSVFGRNFGN